ncbi:MAG: hypothetical protein V7696_08670 [Halioglobus sp.]
MSKKNLMIAIISLLLLTVAVLQFVPEAKADHLTLSEVYASS